MTPHHDVHPRARREPVVDVLCGRHVADPYRWLEDGEAAECADWLAAQTELYARHAASWPGRDRLRALLTDLIGHGGSLSPTLSPPVCRGERRFFLSRRPGQELPVLAVSGPDDESSVLVDPTALDEAGTTILVLWRPSRSGRTLVYQVAHRGAEQVAMWVMDVDTRRVLDGPLHPGRATSVAWLPDDTGFYYVATLGARRQVRLHHVGDAHDDLAVFETGSPQLSVKLSGNGRWLMVSTSDGATSGNILRLADLSTATPRTPLFHRVFDGAADRARAMLKFTADDRIHAVTDAEAPFGRVCVVDGANPAYDAWRTVVAEDSGAVVDDCVALTDPGTEDHYLLVCRTRQGIGELVLHDGHELTVVAAPAPGTITALTAPPGGGEAWFTYTNFVTAPVVHRFSLSERACVPENQQHTPEQAPQVRATVQQVTYQSHDGTPVSMHLITPSGDVRPRPTILTAYGGFGASFAPTYSPTILAWVQCGGAYAIANIRGGGHSTDWHAAGSGAHKPNAFADFASAADWLVTAGWTTPSQLAIKGASHSGLVAAAALTQHPERFGAVVCSDAVLDMTRYQHFGLGTMWTDEFGTADHPTQLETLLSYSPYHNVRPATPYPPVLFTSPRTDPRVDAMHTRKMTAALQHATASDNPVLLRTELDVGHGARSASRWVDFQTDVISFCATHTGLSTHEDRTP